MIIDIFVYLNDSSKRDCTNDLSKFDDILKKINLIKISDAYDEATTIDGTNTLLAKLTTESPNWLRKDEREKIVSYCKNNYIELALYGWDLKACTEYYANITNTDDVNETTKENYNPKFLDEGTIFPQNETRLEEYAEYLKNNFKHTNIIKKEIESTRWEDRFIKVIDKFVSSKDWYKQMKEDESFTLGSYHGEKIKWFKLSEKDGKILAITEKSLDAKKFNNDDKNDYKTSYIRRWLTNDFYNEVFNDVNTDCLVNNEDGDLISLPSREQFDKYISTLYFNLSEAIDYVKSNYNSLLGINRRGTTKHIPYLLKTPASDKKILFVTAEGSELKYSVWGGEVAEDSGNNLYGVRPTIVIDSKKILSSTNEPKKTSKKESPKKIGKEIVLGNFNGEQIVWLPIKSTLDDCKVLCIAQSPIGFVSIKRNDGKEKIDKITTWLEDEFSKNAFDNVETEKIIDINDKKVFILELDELNKYIPSVKERKRYSEDKGTNDKIKKDGYYLFCKTIDDEEITFTEDRGKFPINWIVFNNEIIMTCNNRSGTIEECHSNKDLGIVPAIWVKI